MDDNDIKNLLGQKYTANLILPGDPGESAESSVVINRRNFVMQQVQHCVVGEDGTDPEQYQIDWSIQNDKRFWKGDNAPMAQLYGSVKTGRWYPESIPVQLAQQTTLYVKVTNRYTGTPVTRHIQVVFSGIEKKNKGEE